MAAPSKRVAFAGVTCTEARPGKISTGSDPF
jgi:hypothetical protein